MGYDIREVTVRIVCRVSRHNSDRDAADDALAEELEGRVRAAVMPIAQDPKYTALISYTEGLG